MAASLRNITGRCQARDEGKQQTDFVVDDVLFVSDRVEIFENAAQEAALRLETRQTSPH